jgi:Yip1 domain
MLRPRTYPELLGKALFLESEPFATLVDDDQPWVEGLFLVTTVGVLIGVAHFLGGLLLTASLPAADVVWQTLLNGWQQFNTTLQLSDNPASAEANLRQLWWFFTLSSGYGAGWASLLTLLVMPLSLVALWLVGASVVYLVAYTLGSVGSFNQTLGATALMVAPQLLLLLEIVPFVAVSQLLLLAWSVLILYRAIEVTHNNLPWQQAVLVALAPWLVIALLIGVTGLLVSVAGVLLV